MQPPRGFPSSFGTVFPAPVAQALGTQLAKLLASSSLPNVSPSSSSIASASKRDPEADHFSPALPPPQSRLAELAEAPEGPPAPSPDLSLYTEARVNFYQEKLDPVSLPCGPGVGDSLANVC